MNVYTGYLFCLVLLGKGYGRKEKNIGEQKIYQFALNANIQQ